MPMACSTAARWRRCASSMTCPIMACLTKSGCSQPGPMPGPGQFPRGAHSAVPDLRGHLDRTKSVETLAETGAEILLVPNGSPFESGKDEVRLNTRGGARHRNGLPLAYLNQVGGQDELVFDGASFVLNADRSLAFANAGVPRDGGDHALGARQRGAGAARVARCFRPSRATRRSTPKLRAGP